ncbi:MAG: thioredoxin [Clostridia bacterium]|nr:thioredoxin [Clostridia bacterium]
MRNRYGKWALLAVALILILSGALLGQAREVMRKAMYICLECMGLGA